jgi:hypothetical protein
LTQVLLKTNPAGHQRPNETLPHPYNGVCWIHMEDIASKFDKLSSFSSTPCHKSNLVNPCRISGVRTAPKQSLIIIKWTYQEMMVWMSRELIHFLGGLMEELLKVGQIELIFIHTPATNQTKHDLQRQDSLPTTIDYHQLNLSRDDGMDEQGID